MYLFAFSVLSIPNASLFFIISIALKLCMKYFANSVSFDLKASVFKYKNIIVPTIANITKTIDTTKIAIRFFLAIIIFPPIY